MFRSGIASREPIFFFGTAASRFKLQDETKWEVSVAIIVNHLICLPFFQKLRLLTNLLIMCQQCESSSNRKSYEDLGANE